MRHDTRSLKDTAQHTTPASSVHEQTSHTNRNATLCTTLVPSHALLTRAQSKIHVCNVRSRTPTARCQESRATATLHVHPITPSSRCIGLSINSIISDHIVPDASSTLTCSIRRSLVLALAGVSAPLAWFENQKYAPTRSRYAIRCTWVSIAARSQCGQVSSRGPCRSSRWRRCSPPCPWESRRSSRRVATHRYMLMQPGWPVRTPHPTTASVPRWWPCAQCSHCRGGEP